MAANRYIPIALWKIHGMAAPMANNTEAPATGILRMPKRSEIGPAVKAASSDTTMVITDMVATMLAALSFKPLASRPESDSV